MAPKLYAPADANHGATGNPITVAYAKQIVKGTVNDKLRWDPLNPLTPGYDPVPVYIHAIDAAEHATFSIMDDATGEATEDAFTIDLTDRRLCHPWLPSTPRKLTATKRVAILMICPTYHQDDQTTSDLGNTFKTVATTAGVSLTATGKWPRTEAAEIIDAIVDAVVAGKKVDVKFLRGLYRSQLKRLPSLGVPAKLLPL